MPAEDTPLFTESMKKMNIETEDRPKKYMEQYLQKKEANGKWIEYWVLLRGSYLLFYSHKCEASELRDSFRGSIELTTGSKCTISKRKKYSFPFFLSTSKARFYFKSPTLLLRHQWIHAINLSVMGALPQPPPKALPAVPSEETRSNQSDDEVCQDDNIADESIQDLIDETPLTVESSKEETTDFPSNVILVRSRSPDRDDVIDFLSGEHRTDTSNFQVTNFMNSRNAELSESSKFGIDNLSFEEEEIVQPRLGTGRNWKSGFESRNSGMSAPRGSPSPKFCLSPQMTRSNGSGRLVHSAGSVRSLSSDTLISSPVYNDLLSPVRTSTNNLTVTANRFSRHLISSAPDLNLFTTSTA